MVTTVSKQHLIVITILDDNELTGSHCISSVCNGNLQEGIANLLISEAEDTECGILNIMREIECFIPIISVYSMATGIEVYYFAPFDNAQSEIPHSYTEIINLCKELLNRKYK